ncbi:DUF3455 domain-containing protein [Paraburkholderia acidisoli]|uniref:DUF3455 domain-containing protein n=1 Tax=Paraburkholderia acidisoli TaxID=2571748 RepID=A0A7Z2JHJ3_9BURK|nr:DUF3455 domain-containing protein [Paraburkholderia acidisoli]QGZ65812.1 DUF3455 domain-containing protein [Paraburkholderia acidisoli]
MGAKVVGSKRGSQSAWHPVSSKTSYRAAHALPDTATHAASPAAAFSHGLTRLHAAALAFVCASLAACASAPRPVTDYSLPDMLRAGPEQHLDDVLTAHGQTVYECRGSGTERYWIREGDLATLVDTGRRSVGTVAPGGYFLAYDGSQVRVRRDAHTQVTAGTLPWARLIAQDNARRRFNAAAHGRFARTDVVARLHTTGGLPPDPLCDREGGTLLVPYSADYLVYSPAYVPRSAPHFAPPLRPRSSQHSRPIRPSTVPDVLPAQR